MVRTNPKRKKVVSGVDSSSQLLRLEKMGYGVVGSHSAVKVCHWTKNALVGDSHCWKEELYGISSAGCVQMTPSAVWCDHSCIHCWRPVENFVGCDISNDCSVLDDPKVIIDGILAKRKELLMGHKGDPSLDKKAFFDALNPKLFTLSLSGEPTLYPRIGELFKEIRSRGAVSFLVTNGQNPEVLRSLKQDELPTQLVISTNAPNEKLFKIWHRSKNLDAWDKFNESLDVMNSLKGKVRRVIRLTLVKKFDDGPLRNISNMSEEHVSEYASLMQKANPDFIHIKGYKALGHARKRLSYERQPWHAEVVGYAKKLEAALPEYQIKAEYERSCIIMLAKKGVQIKITKI